MILNMSQVADRVGAKYGTVRQWRQRGEMPEPDMMIGHSPVWYLHTIDNWWNKQEDNSARPNRGTNQAH